MSVFSGDDSKIMRSLMLTSLGFVALTVGLIVLANLLT